MLQRLTNNVLRSTTHRVVNPPPERRGLSRYSMPFFLHFRSDFLIETLPDCISAERPNLYPDADHRRRLSPASACARSSWSNSPCRGGSPASCRLPGPKPVRQQLAKSRCARTRCRRRWPRSPRCRGRQTCAASRSTGGSRRRSVTAPPRPARRPAPTWPPATAMRAIRSSPKACWAAVSAAISAQTPSR